MRIIEQSAIIEDWSKMDLARRVERAARLCYGRETFREPKSFVKALVERKHFSPLEFARVRLHGSIFVSSGINLRDLRRESTYNSLYSEYARMINKDYPEFFEDMVHKWKAYLFKVGENNPRGYEVDNTWIPVLITTNRAVSHQLVRHRHEVAFMQASQRYIRMEELECIRPSVYFEPNTVAEDNWIDAMMEAEHRYAHSLEQGNPAQAARLMLTNSTATRILVYASVGEWGYIFKLRCSAKADPMMRALMIPLRDEFLRRNIISQDYLDNVGRYW